MVRVARSAAKFVVDLEDVNHPLVPAYQANLQLGLQVLLDCLGLAIRQ